MVPLSGTGHYDTAANPADPSEPYDGDASTDSLELDPIDPAQKQQQFPYTAAPAKNAKGYAAAASEPVLVYLDGGTQHHGHLLIADDHGRRIGYANGRRINDIPGAQFLDSKSNDFDNAIEPDYQLPPSGKYTIVADGAGLAKPDRTDVTLIGADFDVTVSNIDLMPDTQSIIDISADGDRVSYTSTDAQTPDIEIGQSWESADYLLTATHAAVGAKGTVTVTLPSDRNVFTIDTTRSRVAEHVGVGLEREDDKATRTFSHDGITVATGGSADVDFDAWDSGGKQIGLTVTSDGRPTTSALAAN